MTAILWHGPTRRLYTDSKMYKDDEVFYVNNKAVSFATPLRVVIPKAEDGQFEFDELVYGFTYTGDRTAAEAMVDRIAEGQSEAALLQGSANLDNLTGFYQAADRLGLLNRENSFTAILFGQTHNVVISAGGGDIGAHPRPVDKTLVLGSGQMAMALLMKQTEGRANPYRLMQHAMAEESSCGGQIYVYEINTQTGPPKFVLCAMVAPPSRVEKQMAALVPEMEFEPDLILNPKVVEQATKDEQDGGSTILDEIEKHVKVKAALRASPTPTPKKPANYRKTPSTTRRKS